MSIILSSGLRIRVRADAVSEVRKLFAHEAMKLQVLHRKTEM